MKITLNELRKTIKTGLITEGLSFQNLDELKPDFFLAFVDRFMQHILNFKSLLYTNRKPVASLFPMDVTYRELDQKIIKAYLQYLLTCVIEKGMSYIPISLSANQDTNFETLQLDLNNPTQGIKGKYTEFIVKILASKAFQINTDDETQMLQSFNLLHNFIQICEKSASTIYKSKMQFFDTQIMPYIIEKQAAGKIRNVPKVSPQSPLQDKITKVFNEFGVVNNKNLIQIMMEEYFEKESFDVKSFAGYDVKLIDFCLQHHYWIEMDIPGNPATIRTFYLNNGNYEKLLLAENQQKDFETFKIEYYDNLSTRDLADLAEKAEEQGMYTSEYIDDLIDIAYNEYLADHSVLSNNKFNVNVKFAHRAMIYACNVYPFKTPYNTLKSTIKSLEISYFKSTEPDDYLVVENNVEYQIRKTTEWCTKDSDAFVGYINGHTDDIIGFILILDNSLPYDDPNGAILAGLREEKAFGRNYPGLKSYKLVNYLNAIDQACTLPPALVNYFSTSKIDTNNPLPTGGNINDIQGLLAKYKQKYDKLNNLTHSSAAFKSGQELHRFLQSQINDKKVNESQMRLLRSYIRHLLS